MENERLGLKAPVQSVSCRERRNRALCPSTGRRSLSRVVLRASIQSGDVRDGLKKSSRNECTEGNAALYIYMYTLSGVILNLVVQISGMSDLRAARKHVELH